MPAAMSRLGRDADDLVARAGGRARASRTRRFVERETLPIVVVGLALAVLALSLRRQMHQDGWLTLVAGRQIVRNGLPEHDTLTAWAGGARWVDQQWLAQLAYYGLYAAGALRLVLLVNTLLIAAALAGGIAVARWTGASPHRAAGVAALCLPLMALQWQLRSQTIAYPLFVALLWLLVADGRSPSRRVFLALPLLALWANVHGSVVLAAGLVSAWGALGVARALRGRGGLVRSLLLVLAPGLCIFASPYGFGLAYYYRRTLFNSALSTYVAEWRPIPAELRYVPFFAVAAASLWLLGRSRGLTAFERVAVLAVAAWSWKSLRGVPWFGLTVTALLPRATDEAWPSGRTAARLSRLSLPLAAAAAAAALAALTVAAATPLSWLRSDWPEPGAAAVAAAARRDPSLKIYATLRYADWLLWTRPELAGRIAIDARLELLSGRRLRDFFDAANRIGEWRSVVAPYRLLVLDAARERDLARALLADRSTRRLYDDGSIAVLVRSSGRSSGRT